VKTAFDNNFRSLVAAFWTVLDGHRIYRSQFQLHCGNRIWVRFPSPAPTVDVSQKMYEIVNFDQAIFLLLSVNAGILRPYKPPLRNTKIA